MGRDRSRTVAVDGNPPPAPPVEHVGADLRCIVHNGIPHPPGTPPSPMTVTGTDSRRLDPLAEEVRGGNPMMLWADCAVYESTLTKEATDGLYDIARLIEHTELPTNVATHVRT